MNDYLRTVGFHHMDGNRHIRQMLDCVRDEADEIKQYSDRYGNVHVQYKKEFAPGVGVISYWVEDEQVEESVGYMPYCESEYEQFHCPVSFEKLFEGTGVLCEMEDPRIGISLIFRLINVMDFFNERNPSEYMKYSVSVSALCARGTVILGIKREEDYPIKRLDTIRQHQMMVNAARKGNRDAAEKLAKEDYMQYHSVNTRIVREDLYTLVDSCFMPRGMSSDRYLVIGDIIACREERNQFSGEQIYILTLDYNAVIFEVTVNKNDLTGEPAKGRRFKGEIVLLGRVGF